MLRKSITIVFLFAMTGFISSSAMAQAIPMNPGQPEGPPPPIPPYVEETPIQVAGGGYCYDGPHPLDARVSNGATWDSTPGRHIHPFPPFDLRLFNQRNGCYFFIGDPNDFGYAGPSYSYYGAHPIHERHGGGWCFMIGGHHHLWQPWSASFVTVGPWFYWEGAYDPFFWTYWPYYHFYYRSHYPHHYSRGLFHRARVVAPRITHVPPPPRTGIGWQGARSGNRHVAPLRALPTGPGYRHAPITPGNAGGRSLSAPRNFTAPRSIAPPPARSLPGNGESFRRGPRR